MRLLALLTALTCLLLAGAACADKDGDTGGYADNDGDGWPASLDCNDDIAAINPAAEEIPYNGIDEDCSEITADDDVDGDGYLYADDCDDNDDDNYPGADESCDDEDNDCDGDVDESSDGRWYDDNDGDGYGDDDRWAAECQEDQVDQGGDCDDTESAINPDAPEVCDDDNTDEDCDGLVDDNDPSVEGQQGWFEDSDGDGFGAGNSELRCDPTSGRTADNGDDCDDDDPSVNPDAAEVCDPWDTDEDCNGLADDDDNYVDASTYSDWFFDGDGDGYAEDGAAAGGDASCDGDGAFTADLFGDCDDGDANINPGAEEVCDPDDVDEDCDGFADDLDPDTDPPTWYQDLDNDGYGDASLGSQTTCDPAANYSTPLSGDCDETDPSVNPGATEVCDALDVDEDCDGFSDDDDVSLDPATSLALYPDDDGDGYGDSSAPAVYACEVESGYALTNTDCDDTDPDVYPGGFEVCDDDDTDEDCDGAADDDDSSVLGAYDWYVDVDGDGYGTSSAYVMTSCDGISGTAPNGSDCDDGDASVNPGAAEDCSNGVDDDCDGRIDGCLRSRSEAPRLVEGVDLERLGMGLSLETAGAAAAAPGWLLAGPLGGGEASFELFSLRGDWELETLAPAPRSGLPELDDRVVGWVRCEDVGAAAGGDCVYALIDDR